MHNGARWDGLQTDGTSPREVAALFCGESGAGKSHAFRQTFAPPLLPAPLPKPPRRGGFAPRLGCCRAYTRLIDPRRTENAACARERRRWVSLVSWRGVWWRRSRATLEYFAWASRRTKRGLPAPGTRPRVSVVPSRALSGPPRLRPRPRPYLRRDLSSTVPHLRRDLSSPRPHLRRDWAVPCHICAGTGLTPATSAPGLGFTPAHICTGT